MDIPNIPQIELISNNQISQDPNYDNLRIVHYSKDIVEQKNWNENRYEFQKQLGHYSVIRVTLCRKGAKDNYRIVAYAHLYMEEFIEIVRYDPSDPPIDDYEAQGMKVSHAQSQSDFKGQKKANMIDFKNYILEGIRGDRDLYLPTITGWQSMKWFDQTIFVSFDESIPDAIYGILYLPKKPIMQADGQTQTAAIFQAFKSADAIRYGALKTLNITLEIQLNVNEAQAGQSFADRNGRGSKKNKNLVIKMDTSSPLSRLRVEAIKDTVFQYRLADGRSTGTSETATKNIVDLSTIEQMILNVVSNGRIKSERFKLRYNKFFLPYCEEFFGMLDEVFGKYWPEQTPIDGDSYRKIYVHGWPFALKAIAKAYYYAKLDKIGPLAASIGKETENPDASLTIEEKFDARVEVEKVNFINKSSISFEELKDRLIKIDWHRYRHHWIVITGHSIKDGKKKTFKLKGTGETKVVALAQNTAGIIENVCNKILSDNWLDLCSNIDEPLD